MGFLHHPFWLQLVLALFGHYFSTFILNVWLRIIDEGSVPEMRIWSISLINSDLKWCILYILVEVSIWISSLFAIIFQNAWSVNLWTHDPISVSHSWDNGFFWNFFMNTARENLKISRNFELLFVVLKNRQNRFLTCTACQEKHKMHYHTMYM